MTSACCSSRRVPPDRRRPSPPRGTTCSAWPPLRFRRGSSARGRRCGRRCRCFISVRRRSCSRRCWSVGRACSRPDFTLVRSGTSVRACGAVGFVGAGAMVSMLWNQPPDRRDAELPLRFISAAPIAADIYRGIEQRYDCRVVTMYGLTEAFPIAFKAVSDDGRARNVGHGQPGIRRAHRGSRRAAMLPSGAVGEITCRPKSPHAMSDGYVSAVVGLRASVSSRIRSGSTPAISAQARRRANSPTSTASRTRCAGAVRTSRRSRSRQR